MNVITVKKVSGSELVVSNPKWTEDKQFLQCDSPLLLGMGKDGNATLIPYIFTSGTPQTQSLTIPAYDIEFTGPTDADIVQDYLTMMRRVAQTLTEAKLEGVANIVTEEG